MKTTTLNKNLPNVTHMVLLSVSYYLSSSWYEERLWDEWRQHRLREVSQMEQTWSRMGGQPGNHRSTLECRENPVSFAISDWWNFAWLQTGIGARSDGSSRHGAALPPGSWLCAATNPGKAWGDLNQPWQEPGCHLTKMTAPHFF